MLNDELNKENHNFFEVGSSHDSFMKNMKTLYIVGNGFDIQHGLNTDYWNFRAFIEENDAPFLMSFEHFYNINPIDTSERYCTKDVETNWKDSVKNRLWSSFEKSMGYPDFDDLLGNAENASEDMPMNGIKDTMDKFWEGELGFIRRLKILLNKWIESIDTSMAVCKKRDLNGCDDIFLTFNYTDVLEKTYDIQDVFHVHGGVSKLGPDIDKPIMGHCNLRKIQHYSQYATEASNELEEAASSVLEAATNYLAEIYKDTEQIIFENQTFFNRLNIVNRVVVIGWSAGEADIEYLREIIKHVASDSLWEIYFYNDAACKSLKSAFDKIIFPPDTKISYNKSEHFWD